MRSSATESERIREFSLTRKAGQEVGAGNCLKCCCKVRTGHMTEFLIFGIGVQSGSSGNWRFLVWKTLRTTPHGQKRNEARDN